MYQNILVPIDDSNLSIETVVQAVAFAKSISAKLVFFNARHDFGSTSQGALLLSVSPASYAEEIKGASQGILAKAEAEAARNGVKFESMAVTSDQPAEAIIEAARANQCDLIFMSSHGTRRGLKGLFAPSRTQKVISNSTIPVLVASVETNIASRSRNVALAVIKGEHRSLAALIHALEQSIQESAATNHPINIKLLKAIFNYLNKFTSGLHHPKEEKYLFSHLGKYTEEFSEEIGVLESQHKLEPFLIKSMISALAAYEVVSSSDNFNVVALAINTYAEFIWKHMGIEESIILPACMKYLQDSDWALISAAFEENADPRFDTELQAGYSRFFSKLMNMSRD